MNGLSWVMCSTSTMDTYVCVHRESTRQNNYSAHKLEVLEVPCGKSACGGPCRTRRDVRPWSDQARCLSHSPELRVHVGASFDAARREQVAPEPAKSVPV